MIRRIVYILVCLGLALQGSAVRALEKTPCPMEASMQAMLAAGDIDTMDLPDCCNDLQTFAQTGHACKAGTDCGVPAAIAPASLAAAADVNVPASAPQSGAVSPLAEPAATPWRPPAQH